MGISLNPSHLKLYGEIAALLLKYGNSDLVHHAGLEEIVDFLDKYTETARRYALTRVLKEFRGNLTRELDYVREAANMGTLWRNLAEFDGVWVPQAIPSHTTSRVLTMDYVRGTRITALSQLGGG